MMPATIHPHTTRDGKRIEHKHAGEAHYHIHWPGRSPSKTAVRLGGGFTSAHYPDIVGKDGIIVGPDPRGAQ